MTIIKRCILLIQFLTVPDTSNLIMNIKFIKIKVTVRINLKRPNHNYPSCNLVGRHFSCDHALYSLGGVRVPDLEIWPVISTIFALTDQVY